MWGTLGSMAMSNLPTILGGAGAALRGGAQASAENRGAKLDAGMEANKLNQQAYRDWQAQMIAREQAGAGVRNDAWRAVQQGKYVSDWKQPTQQFSPYTRALVGPDDELRNAGRVRQDDAFSRLAGNVIPMPEQQRYDLDPKLLEGSTWEKLQGYLGAGLGVAGAIPRGTGTAAPQVDPRTGLAVRPGLTDPNVWNNINF
jgi:hypothetical protein